MDCGTMPISPPAPPPPAPPPCQVIFIPAVETAVTRKRQPSSRPSTEINQLFRGLKKTAKLNPHTEHIVSHYDRHVIELHLDYICPPIDRICGIDISTTKRPIVTKPTPIRPATRKTSNTSSSKRSMKIEEEKWSEEKWSLSISNPIHTMRPVTHKNRNTTNRKPAIKTEEEGLSSVSHLNLNYSTVIPIQQLKQPTPVLSTQLSKVMLKREPNQHLRKKPTPEPILPPTLIPNSFTDDTQSYLEIQKALSIETPPTAREQWRCTPSLFDDMSEGGAKGIVDSDDVECKSINGQLCFFDSKDKIDYTKDPEYFHQDMGGKLADNEHDIDYMKHPNHAQNNDKKLYFFDDEDNIKYKTNPDSFHHDNSSRGNASPYGIDGLCDPRTANSSRLGTDDSQKLVNGLGDNILNDSNVSLDTTQLSLSDGLFHNKPDFLQTLIEEDADDHLLSYEPTKFAMVTENQPSYISHYANKDHDHDLSFDQSSHVKHLADKHNDHGLSFDQPSHVKHLADKDNDRNLSFDQLSHVNHLADQDNSPSDAPKTFTIDDRDHLLSHDHIDFHTVSKDQPSHIHHHADKDNDDNLSYVPSEFAVVLDDQPSIAKHSTDKKDTNIEMVLKNQPSHSNQHPDNMRDNSTAITILSITSSLTAHTTCSTHSTRSLQFANSFSSSYSSENPNILVLKQRLNQIRNKIRGNLSDIRVRNDNLFSPSMRSTYDRKNEDDTGEEQNETPPCEKEYHNIPNLMDGVASEDDVTARGDHQCQLSKLSIESEKPPSPTGVDDFESAMVVEESTNILKKSSFFSSEVAGVDEIGGTEPLSTFGKSDSVSKIAMLPATNLASFSIRNENLYDGGAPSMPISMTRRCLGEENQCILKLKARLRQIEKSVQDGKLCNL